MNFADAVEFTKKFPICRPKIFKGFIEWGICDTETEGYVVFTDAATAREPGFGKLKDYVKTHNLRINCSSDYLMISTFC